MNRLDRQSRGFMIADAVIALIVLGILMTALGVSVWRQSLATSRLAAQRERIRLAEETIIAMQTGQAPPPAPAGLTVNIRELVSSSPASGTAWATITVSAGPRSSELTGLVRADALKGKTK